MEPLLYRPRRLRQNPTLRKMLQDVHIRPENLIYPLFIKEGLKKKNSVASMPGIFQLPLADAVEEAVEDFKKGVRAVILFGIPAKKDKQASGAYAKDGIVQKAIRVIKKKCPELYIITDVCLCEYMDHGHCGLVTSTGEVQNDPSLELLAKTALSHAQAGADMVAPSDMMDGRVGAIRTLLDIKGFMHVPMMSYAVKYASAFYGPFRDAAESAPKFGDRRTYQMDPAQSKEALKEAFLDEEEGADILMVKPAGAYLDIIRQVADQTTLPVAAYQVSGEYSMIVAAVQNGWIDRKALILESLIAIKRAGAQLILTYFAKEIVDSL